jgi:hypothetical protein
MPGKSGTPKKHAVGKARVKKDSPAKESASRSRTGSHRTKSSSQSSTGKVLKSGGCLLPTISIFFILIWFAVNLF